MPVNVLRVASAMATTALLLISAPTLLHATATAASASQAAHWPQWEAYKHHFIQRDGRVIEHSQQGRTTSEGQAYALFHALVAGDRERFGRILRWTENNLAGGDLASRLPAWLWGRRDDGSWGVIDANPASDADMWLAWTLLEAGRLWRQPRLEKLGHAVLTQIEQREIAHLPHLGRMLLPGPEGFHHDQRRWKLNLSYLPVQLLRRFSRSGDRELWNEVLDNSLTLIRRASRNGIVPDWVVYHADGRLEAVGDDANRIGYDAIRVYLWAGMLPPGDPARAVLLKALTRDCGDNLIASAADAAGIRIAIGPLMKATGNHHCLGRLVRFVDGAWHRDLLGKPARYYDQNLSLFALGWLDKRFAFTADGGLLLPHHETP